jgi:excisionase family DNA binding protein
MPRDPTFSAGPGVRRGFTPVNERSPYLSVNEAAALLGVHPETLYRAIRRNEIEHVRVGSRILIAPAALDKLVRASA